MQDKKSKHIPKRMCVGCRKMHNKNELIRIVIEKDELVIDKKHNIMSRGIYLCKNEECILNAQKKKALSRLIKKQVSDGFYEGLGEYATR